MNNKTEIEIPDDTESEKSSEQEEQLKVDQVGDHKVPDQLRLVDPHSMGLALQAFHVQTMLKNDKAVVDFFE